MKIQHVKIVSIAVAWGLFLLLHPSEIVNASPKQSGNSASQEVNMHVQEAIHSANDLILEQQFADALRILFDVHKQEKEAKLPKKARHKIYEIVLKFIYEEQSLFMDVLRDPDVPVEEKNAMLSELRILAEKGNDRFLEKYRGPFLELMTSPQLIRAEKTEILEQVESIIRQEFISDAQKEKIQEKSAQSVIAAEQKLQEAQYEEAFRIIWDNINLENEAGMGSESSYATHQLIETLLNIIHQDNSPLMAFFRNTEIPLHEKNLLFTELRKLAQGKELEDESVLLQKHYQGTIIQLMRSDQLTVQEKLDMLGYIQDGIEKEYSTIP